ncbi:hypothetical protein [Anabaena azotica]|uniref:Uncharacterized protein n=1 Tax=Anabaena azotica FACHB-119 TaxID=947527 RepID=A0ABR8D4L4_9NOST|nr:hypothetical protein [Anabaena azotica]MBD2501634.1 hypothetical protein [Anabaena azotica FACHB-119]
MRQFFRRDAELESCLLVDATSLVRQVSSETAIVSTNVDCVIKVHT